MANDHFVVKPVNNYQGANYPSAYRQLPSETPSEKEKPHPLMVFASTLIMLWLMIGILCCVDFRSDSCPNGLVIDAAGNCIPPDDDDCVPGNLFCQDGITLMTCNDQGDAWQAADCTDLCQQSAGWSEGCNAVAEDPCQCKYDVIDGDPLICDPGQMHCADENTLAVCKEEYFDFELIDCHQYCQENGEFPEMGWSLGCDIEAQDPCQCQYDIVMGVEPVCTPGEMQCWDENTLAVCSEDLYFETIDCNQYCQENAELPDTGWSMGCDLESDDPCQCVYDVVDGYMTECSPGEVSCQDEETVLICNDDYWSWSEVGCYEYCSDKFGSDYFPTGCNMENDLDNICGCSQS
jgi:hypothetical protein